MVEEETSGSMLCASFNYMVPLPLMDLPIKQFSKSLADWVYTWYVNLKAVLIHDWEHLVFFAKLNQKRQRLEKTWMPM